MNDTAHKIPPKPMFESKIWADVWAFCFEDEFPLQECDKQEIWYTFTTTAWHLQKSSEIIYIYLQILKKIDGVHFKVWTF